MWHFGDTIQSTAIKTKPNNWNRWLQNKTSNWNLTIHNTEKQHNMEKRWGAQSKRNRNKTIYIILYNSISITLRKKISGVRTQESGYLREKEQWNDQKLTEGRLLEFRVAVYFCPGSQLCKFSYSVIIHQAVHLWYGHFFWMLYFNEVNFLKSQWL